MLLIYKNKSVVELAEHAAIPVINGLTDMLHPCQALTDYFTVLEKFGSLANIKFSYVGDGIFYIGFVGPIQTSQGDIFIIDFNMVAFTK